MIKWERAFSYPPLSEIAFPDQIEFAPSFFIAFFKVEQSYLRPEPELLTLTIHATKYYSIHPAISFADRKLRYFFINITFYIHPNVMLALNRY